jgi:16S rRNA (uracil1498-N3)-methyltransferase
MSNRYFIESPISDDLVVLVGPEAHHLAHVMRAGPGALVTLFDGSGAEFSARVERVGRDKVELLVLARHEIDRESPLALTLAVALPKGDRQRWLVEKAVELGVRRLVPLVTARLVARPTGRTLARLRRTVVEASKQCGRNRLLEIAQPQMWDPFVQTTADAPYRLLAHPDVAQPPSAVSDAKQPPSAVSDTKQAHLPAEGGWATPSHNALLAVGPEGGFSSDEVATAIAAGWQAVDLGPRTLRVETAALLLAALVIGCPGGPRNSHSSFEGGDHFAAPFL